MKKFRSFVKDKKKKKPVYKHVNLGFIEKHKKDQKKKRKSNLSEKIHSRNTSTFDYDRTPLEQSNKWTKELHFHQHTILTHPYHEPNLKSYTTSSYFLNKKLINGDHLTDEHKEIDHSLGESLKKGKLPKPMFVYTGVKENMFQHSPDKDTGMIHFTHKGYTSTSLREKIAHGFTREHYVHDSDMELPDQDKFDVHAHVLKIHVPKKSHGLYMHGISNFPDEHEVLFHKNIKLDIHPTPDTTDSMISGERWRTHIWHAKLVHDGIAETSHAKDYK